MRTHNRLRLLVIAVAILFILVALCVSGALNIVSFKQNYLESLSAGYKVAAMSAKRTIEYSVRYGKPLDKFNGMGEILAELKNSLEILENVRVIATDGRVLYDPAGPVKDQWLPWQLRQAANSAAEAEGTPYAVGVWEKEYHVFIPLRDKQNAVIGTLDLSIQAALINNQVNTRVWAVVQATVVIVIVTLNFMVFVLFAIGIVNDRGEVRRRRVIMVVAAVFTLAQVAFCLVNMQLFQKAYVEMAKNTMAVLAHSVKEDVGSVVSRGVTYNRLVGLDQYLGQLIVNSPEIDRIAITDSSGAIMYRAPAGGAGADPKPGEPLQYRYFQALPDDKNAVGGTIHVWLSQEYIYGKSKELVIDAVATTGLFFLFLIELIFYVPILQRYFAAGAPKWTAASPHPLRLSGFMLYFTASLELGFCAVQTENLAMLRHTLTAGSVIPAVLTGLGALAGAFGSRYLQRDTARLLYIGGALLALTGGAVAMSVSGLFPFVVAMAVSGLGWGGAAAGWRHFLPADRDPRLVSLYRGMFCGSLAGCIAGALLATRMSWGLTFAGGAIILLLVLPASRQWGEAEGPTLERMKVGDVGWLTGLLTLVPPIVVWGAVAGRAEGLAALLLAGVAGSRWCWRRLTRRTKTSVS
ncbi:MAG TPA: hypothetical protein VN611_05725 [Patescibacteria group bacterium]|nr:hypothetical protein [Patescibacteria group bacterium]